MRKRQQILALICWMVAGGTITFAEERKESAAKQHGPSAPVEETGESPRSEPDSDESSAESSRPNLAIQIGLDFRNLVTQKENLAVVGIGGAVSWGSSRLDDRVLTSRLNSELYDGNAYDKVFEPGEIIGGVAVQGGVAVVTYTLGKAFGVSEVEELGRDLVRAQILNQVVTQALKYSIGRARPDGSNARSFPSGHASGAFTTATVLHRRYGWKVGVPAYAMATHAAISRLTENKHHLSDVVFGAAIGIMAARTVTVDLGSNRFAVAPLIVPQGGGVQFTWLGTAPPSRY